MAGLVWALGVIAKRGLPIAPFLPDYQEGVRLREGLGKHREIAEWLQEVLS
jgi:hypothetical protein